MQLKFVKFLLKLLAIRPKLQHLVILFAPLVILFRFNHIIHFSDLNRKDFKDAVISIGKTAHAAQETPVADINTQPLPESFANPTNEFDPLLLDENQVRVLQALADARGQKTNDTELEQQKRLIELGQEKIAKQLEKLEKLKTDLEKKRSFLTKEEIQNISQTAKIYENMKPAAAAEIYNKLELVVLVQLIKHMNQKKASAIIAAMEPKKARYLTIELLRPDPVMTTAP